MIFRYIIFWIEYYFNEDMNDRPVPWYFHPIMILSLIVIIPFLFYKSLQESLKVSKERKEKFAKAWEGEKKNFQS